MSTNTKLLIAYGLVLCVWVIEKVGAILGQDNFLFISSNNILKSE